MTERRDEITRLLAEMQSGDQGGRERLLTAVYEELKQLAQSLMRKERADHTLQPTALVHEAVMRIFGGAAPHEIPNRSYLFAMLAHAMRRILVEHARRRKTDRRGGQLERVALDEVAESFETTHGFLLIDLEEALSRLADINQRCSEVVTLRFFGGMEMQEISDHLGTSLSTVERDWRFARAWLRRQLNA